jgi:16S rRNA (cytidine1402-2'-O)-methyltransferase
MAGTLYVVATPLGNLEDVTMRALRVLKEVALVAAEDTRHSRKLLTHYGIATPLYAYHDHAERERAPRLVERLLAGDDVALISDAGTPGISDPGYRLVCASAAAGIRVVPIPGASAVVAALSASALPTDRFAFEGFVPARPAARRAFYEGLRSEPRTTVCFEAGRRLDASLGDLVDVLGARQIVVARELTKMFEEFLRGEATEVRSRLAGEVRGEVTLLIAGAPPAEEASEDEMRAAVADLRARGLGLKEISKLLAAERKWKRSEVYRVGLEADRDRR